MKPVSPGMVQLAEKMWFLNIPLWVLPLQCPTSSFSNSPDAGYQTHPISADPAGRQALHEGKRAHWEGDSVPTQPPSCSSWRLLVQQTNSTQGSLPFPQLPAAVQAIENGLKVQASIVHSINRGVTCITVPC